MNQRVLRNLVRFYADVQNIMKQSKGVAGWHLNGEIAEWSSFDLPNIDDSPRSDSTAEGNYNFQEFFNRSRSFPTLTISDPDRVHKLLTDLGIVHRIEHDSDSERGQHYYVAFLTNEDRILAGEIL